MPQDLLQEGDSVKFKTPNYILNGNGKIFRVI